MKVLEKLSESFVWSKDHQRLLEYLQEGNIHKALEKRSELFSHDDNLSRFPTIREAAERLLLDCFKIENKDQGFHVLALDRALDIKKAFFSGQNADFLKRDNIFPSLRNFVIVNLHNGDYDSINRAIVAHRQFLDSGLNLVGDKNFSRGVLRALVINMINEERLYSQNIQSICQEFVGDKNYIVQGAALSAVRFWRDQGRMDRVSEINNKYLWNFEENTDKKRVA